MIKYETNSHIYYCENRSHLDRAMETPSSGETLYFIRHASIVIEKDTCSIIKCKMDTPISFLTDSVELRLRELGNRIITFKYMVDWDKITESVLTYVKQMQQGIELRGAVEISSANIVLSGKSIEIQAPRRSGKTTWFNQMVLDQNIPTHGFGAWGTCLLTDTPFTIVDESQNRPEKSTGVVVTVLTPRQ